MLKSRQLEQECHNLRSVKKKNFPKMFSKESHKIFKYRRGWLAYPILFSILNHLSVALKSNG